MYLNINLVCIIFLKENKDCIIPREYQLKLLESAKEKNTILFLPAGSGKTYIATMLIRHLGESLTKYAYYYNL